MASGTTKINASLSKLARATDQKPDFSRLSLPWKYNVKFRSWTVDIPVKLWCGEGIWCIWFQPRPGYCDRGRWDVVIESQGVPGPDSAEGFTRYFFSLQYGMEEMEMWVSVREETMKENPRDKVVGKDKD